MTSEKRGRLPPFHRERMLRIALPGEQDVYMFLLDLHDAVVQALDAPPGKEAAALDAHSLWCLNHCLLPRLVERARTPDEYEPQPDLISPIGGTETRVAWCRGLEWTIEDFFALIIAADNVVVARENQWLMHGGGHAEGEGDRGQQILWQLAEQRPAERYPELLLSDPALSVSPPWGLLEVKCMLIWISLAIDGRIERLLCKRNDMLAEMELDVPTENEILAMRIILPQALTSYVRGLSTRRQFLDYIRAAYQTGRQGLPPLHPTWPEMPLVVSSLFDPDQSVIAHIALPTRLVFRTREMLGKEDTMQVDPQAQDDDEEEEEEESVPRYPSSAD
jgi:hypothetical protein